VRRIRLLSTKAWLALAVLAAMLAGGALALSPSQGRQSLVDQLQRAATPARTSAGFARGSSSGLSIAATLTPNRASGPIGLSLRVLRDGRPLDGAQVRVGFSMPSMDMFNAYTAELSASAGGRYGATIPVLGMSGRWSLRIDVTPRSGPALTVTINDRIGA